MKGEEEKIPARHRHYPPMLQHTRSNHQLTWKVPMQ